MTKQPRYDVIFNGHITTETPFHTSPPGDKKNKGLLPRMRIGNGTAVPVITAAGIRGTIRRAAYELVTNALMEREKIDKSPFNLDDYYLNTLGGFARKSDGVVPTIASRERNPITSLFGASHNWVEGRLWVECAYPHLAEGEIFETDFVHGVRKDDLMKAEVGIYGLGQDVFDKFRERQEAASADTKTAVKGADLKKKARGATDEERVAIHAEMAELEGADDGPRTVSAQLLLEGYEVIPMQSKLKHRMSLIGVTESEAGMFIEALREFSTRPVLGAKMSNGMGLVSAQYEATIFNSRPHSVVGGSEISFGGPMREFNCGPELQRFSDAWSARLTDMSVEDFKYSEKR